MTCAQHHALVVGNLFRTCLIDGTWDGVEPVCEGFKTITLSKQRFMCQSESGFKKMLSNISRYYTMFVVTCDEQDYLYIIDYFT